jgi:predicted RecB family nuclease
VNGADYPFPGLTGAEPCTRGNPERFFPKPGQNKIVKASKEECAGCPLVEACLDYALRHDVVGIWGGSTARERRAMREERGITAEPVIANHLDRGLVYRMAARGAPTDVIAAAVGARDRHVVAQIIRLGRHAS